MYFWVICTKKFHWKWQSSRRTCHPVNNSYRVYYKITKLYENVRISLLWLCSRFGYKYLDCEKKQIYDECARYFVSKILELNQLDVNCNMQFLEPDVTNLYKFFDNWDIPTCNETYKPARTRFPFRRLTLLRKTDSMAVYFWLSVNLFSDLNAISSGFN